MTLDKAIKVLERNCPLPSEPLLKEFGEAINLGIEALKRHKWQRDHTDLIDLTTFTGETDEDPADEV